MKKNILIIISIIWILTSCSKNITPTPTPSKITFNNIGLNVEYSDIYQVRTATYKDSVLVFYYYSDSLQVNITNNRDIYGGKKVISKWHIGKPPFNTAIGEMGNVLILNNYTFPE
jgi:hypothetical protein